LREVAMKKNEGMSLFEIVSSLALLVIIVPIFFGLFFANVRLSGGLSTKADMRETANDVQSFIKLSNYDRVYDLAKTHELLAIEEVEEAGLLSRKFVKCDSLGRNARCNFVAKFELADLNEGSAFRSGKDEVAAIPLRCKIYHVKSARQNLSAKDVPQFSKLCDGEYDLLLVKNR
jgi:hypothetical protein